MTFESLTKYMREGRGVSRVSIGTEKFNPSMIDKSVVVILYNKRLSGFQLKHVISKCMIFFCIVCFEMLLCLFQCNRDLQYKTGTSWNKYTWFWIEIIQHAIRTKNQAAQPEYAGATVFLYLFYRLTFITSRKSTWDGTRHNSMRQLRNRVVGTMQTC